MAETKNEKVQRFGRKKMAVAVQHVHYGPLGRGTRKPFAQLGGLMGSLDLGSDF